MHPPHPPRGRGTGINPGNRYERLQVEYDAAGGDDLPAAPTIFYRDHSRSVLAENDSPDIGFRFSLNPYRGCEHGCIYCYARPSHEYLSFNAGLDFERRIVVKTDAPERLREALLAPRWQQQPVALSGNTDCYQPVERQLRLTRRCLEVFRELRNPVEIATKNRLVTRDIDVLQDLAAHGAIHVFLSLTSLDDDLAARLEPRASRPSLRLAAVAALAAAGIPVGVMVSPVIPGLTDSEIPAVVAAAAAAGARAAAYTLVRLPPPVDALFEEWLDRHYPARRRRILGRLRECRHGALDDARFGHRMRGQGVYADHVSALFHSVARRQHIDQPLPPLNAAAFARPERPGAQLALF